MLLIVSRPLAAAAALALMICIPSAPAQASSLKGAVIGAGVGAIVGGKKSVRNGAIAGAIIGGVKKNKRKRR